MKYYTFKEKNDKPYHDFISKNIFFAFSQEQYKEGLAKFNIKEEEAKDKLYKYFGGGFMLKSAAEEEKKILKKRDKHLRKYLNNFNNLVDALIYEMNNYECAYTGEYSKGLYAFGFSKEDLKKNKKLLKAYTKARKHVWNWYIKHN